MKITTGMRKGTAISVVLRSQESMGVSVVFGVLREAFWAVRLSHGVGVGTETCCFWAANNDRLSVLTFPSKPGITITKFRGTTHCFSRIPWSCTIDTKLRWRNHALAHGLPTYSEARVFQGFSDLNFSHLDTGHTAVSVLAQPSGVAASAKAVRNPRPLRAGRNDGPWCPAFLRRFSRPPR